ncbi:MAG: DUF192 domain-containing protein [Herpetosiphonaceae bacterium]|nr:DUF192 domain-containing protein [Herpetosiphonaceae bacterium]
MERVAIRNMTKQTTVASAAERATSFLSRGRGLLGRKGLPIGGGLVIVPCANIHMIGMQFALDVIFLDRAGRVVKLYPDLRPWRPYAGARKAHTTLELPVGAIRESATTLGDLLMIELPA